MQAFVHHLKRAHSDRAVQHKQGEKFKVRQGIDFQFADVDETIPDQSVEFGSVKDKEKSSYKAVEQTSRLVEAPQVLAIVSDSMEHIPHRLEDGNLSFHEVGMDLANQENPEETQRSIS